MSHPDAYTNLHDAPSSGDDYQPGARTAEQLNNTDGDNQDRFGPVNPRSEQPAA